MVVTITIESARRECYPSEYSCLITLGTLKCHHCQSVGSLAKIFPDVVCISVESYDLKATYKSLSIKLDSITTTTYKIKCCNFSPLRRWTDGLSARGVSGQQ